MPYSNMPKNKWGKMERCVGKVKGTVDNPYSVCYSSIMDKIVRNKKNKKK